MFVRVFLEKSKKKSKKKLSKIKKRAKFFCVIFEPTNLGVVAYAKELPNKPFFGLQPKSEI